jgi:adenylate kinase family enzyme/8-oxo-dGTP pyrophosphatase MutT (NUDIX family)
MALRILVYGVTGSGKTTAAQRIAARTGLPVTLVDELTWLPGWVPVAEDVQRERFTAIVAEERWVLDTAYGAWLDVVLPRADLVVGLDYPRWLSLGRLVRRSLRRVLDRKRICNGNTETLRQLVSRDSILAWHFRSFARKRHRLRAWAAAPDGPEVLLFSHPRELDAWIAALEPPRGPGAVAVVRRGQEVLVIKRHTRGRDYAVLPGGSVEPGETFEEAAVRELREESTLRARVDRPLHAATHNGREARYFLMTDVEGTPELSGAELEAHAPDNSFELRWACADELDAWGLQPEHLRADLPRLLNW